MSGKQGQRAVLAATHMPREERQAILIRCTQRIRTLQAY